MAKSRRKLKIILPAIACAVLFFVGIWFVAQRQLERSDAYATVRRYLYETEEIVATYGMLEKKGWFVSGMDMGNEARFCFDTENGCRVEISLAREDGHSPYTVTACEITKTP